VAEISDGKIAIFFKCPSDRQKEFKKVMLSMGAESVEPKEAQEL